MFQRLSLQSNGGIICELMYTFPVMENSTKNETEEHTKGKRMHARNPRANHVTEGKREIKTDVNLLLIESC